MTDAHTPDRDDSSESAGPDMILSGDELVIDTELVEVGRVRLVKRVQVETVTRTIELRREILEIQRFEPVVPGQDAGTPAPNEDTIEAMQTGPMASGSLEEGIVEIVLMQEEAVITTRTIPKERVRIRKHVSSRARTIDADLRVERADLEPGV
jgi:stress response protein YsnF